ncbi:MAG: heavy metal-binding domain-containing protein [Amylibacter sp.]|nr:heavy metal-binding domain-containing protein [Amylibacter sp.]
MATCPNFPKRPSALAFLFRIGCKQPSGSCRLAARDTHEKRELHLTMEAITLTTETAPNLKITRRIEIVTAGCAVGMNIFKDLFVGVREIVGGRSEALQKTMRISLTLAPLLESTAQL